MYILMSFPRSGNSFIRYCIELLSNYITLDGKLKNSIKEVLYGERNTGDIVYKTHNLYDSNTLILENIKNCDFKLITIIRNPYEVVNRKTNNNEIITDILLHKRLVEFSRILKDHNTYKGEKIIIYYEDFILNIEHELIKLLEFLNCYDDKKVKDFVNNLDEHRTESLRCYVNKQHNLSHTKGLKVKYHNVKDNEHKIKIYLDSLDFKELDRYKNNN